MASKSYALGEGEAERLELKWRGRFKEMVVSLDGSQLNPEPFSRAEVDRGQSFELSDGSRLFLSLQKNALAITRDGVPLPGSATDPTTAAKSASTILWLVAAFTAALGIFVYVETGAVAWIGIGYIVLFGALGFLVRGGSLGALWVGVVVYSIDSLLALFTIATGGGNLGTLLIRAFLILGLVRAVPGVKRLRESRAESSSA